MAVTIDRFELLPGAAPTADADAKPAAAAGEGGAPPPPSRHEILRALRLEHARQARVRAH